MVAEQNMMQAITQGAIDAATAMTVAVKAENPANTASSVQIMPRRDNPAPKQSTFNWKARQIPRAMKLQN